MIFALLFGCGPSADEIALAVRFYQKQRARLEEKELDAATLSGSKEGDLVERAAWAMLARALLNLDETVTKR